MERCIITRTYSGAIDLYHGIPDLLNATIVDVKYDNKNNDYQTTLVIKDTRDQIHNIIIASAD